MTLVETNTVGSVITITLVDEERRNALSDQLVRELLSAIDEAEANPEVRVVVVTNRGSTFCAGANLAERSRVVEGNERRDTVDISELFLRIRRSPKPFVGRVAGHCVAGGVGLAAVMDISVAVATVTFGFSEVRLGLAPAIISVVCLPKMRLADAQSTFLRANRFSGTDAARMGLINTAVALDDLDHEIDAVLNDLLAGEPHALDVAKQLTTASSTMSAEETFAWASQLSATLFHSDAAREGMRAFLEKQPASWVTSVTRDQ